jgi:predicted ATPase
MPIRNAPAYLPLLIGREAELAEIARLIADPAGRIVTLTGPGGIGKTRLALEAVDLQSSRFADGAWFVELAGLSEPALVPQAVAATLDLQTVGDRAPAEILAAHLQARRVLLLLDNCEHLADACAQLVQTLVARCPGVTVMTTSRQPLRVPGEVVWPVPPLSLPDLAYAADSQTPSEAVRLFVDRAQRASPAFALTAANAAHVAAICHHLDGLPLAIELAAPWVRVLSPAQIAARLGQRFELLAGSGSLPARHQTLQAALDWSPDRLPPAEQRLFRRLSVFAGTFDLESAEGIGAGEAWTGPPCSPCYASSWKSHWSRSATTRTR